MAASKNHEKARKRKLKGTTLNVLDGEEEEGGTNCCGDVTMTSMSGASDHPVHFHGNFDGPRGHAHAQALGRRVASRCGRAPARTMRVNFYFMRRRVLEMGFCFVAAAAAANFISGKHERRLFRGLRFSSNLGCGAIRVMRGD